MKKLVCLFTIISLFAIKYVFAADYSLSEGDSIKALRNAITAFDNNDYGKALKYSEDAILYRKQQIDKQTVILKNSLTSKRVQTAGDKIDAILVILESRKEKNSCDIINFYLKKKGNDFFDNSMQALLDYMDSSKVYPEAQKIIGDIYKIEGEYDFAEEYYNLALKNANVLDIPNEKYDILYMLADISRLQNDFEKMEVYLLNILAQDDSFKDSALKKSMLHTIKTNKKGSMEKFFSLYRASNFISIDAYNQLAQYYYDNDYIEKAIEFSALSTITTFSKIIDILSSRNSEYSYTDLSTFFQETAFYDDIVQWGSTNNAWRSFNILAKYADEEGYSTFARELLVVLIQFSPETYWQKDAVLQLETME